MVEQAKARELLAAEMPEFQRVVVMSGEYDDECVVMIDESLRAITTALEAGRADGKAQVVAWLRQNASSMNATSSTAIAEYIERGEHVAEGEG